MKPYRQIAGGLVAMYLGTGAALAAPLTIEGDFVRAVVTDLGVLSSLRYDSAGSRNFPSNGDYVSPGIPFEGFGVRIGTGVNLRNANSEGADITGKTIRCSGAIAREPSPTILSAALQKVAGSGTPMAAAAKMLESVRGQSGAQASRPDDRISLGDLTLIAIDSDYGAGNGRCAGVMFGEALRQSEYLRVLPVDDVAGLKICLHLRSWW